MLRFLAALLLAATATTPAVPGPALLPTPPPEHPTETDVPGVVTGDGCTYTVLGTTTITARHCLPWNARQLGWTLVGDRAWHGPTPAWADPASIPRGATIYGIGYPHANGRTVFALSALQVQTVTVAGRQVEVLMALGEGVPCSSGASGMVGWVTDDGTARPVGTLAVYSVDPDVTGLPAGQYVCGFAL